MSLQPISSCGQQRLNAEAPCRSRRGGLRGSGYSLPSHPLHCSVSFFPPQMPQISITVMPYGIILQSRHVLLPLQMPHRSSLAVPPMTPLQSMQEQSFPPQTPHWSVVNPRNCRLPYWYEKTEALPSQPLHAWFRASSPAVPNCTQVPQESGTKPVAHFLRPRVQLSLVVLAYQSNAPIPPPAASAALEYSPHRPHLSYPFPLFLVASQPLHEASQPPHTPSGNLTDLQSS
mmetsp:Transcript_44061/g.64654  ORF Transcript_44061/g.64654 Transcript_44061/m.64654 type:complete len:231 (+) Transcript_44061:699-1391(+)